jgi:hypothetical protein
LLLNHTSSWHLAVNWSAEGNMGLPNIFHCSDSRWESCAGTDVTGKQNAHAAFLFFCHIRCDCPRAYIFPLSPHPSRLSHSSNAYCQGLELRQVFLKTWNCYQHSGP